MFFRVCRQVLFLMGTTEGTIDMDASEFFNQSPVFGMSRKEWEKVSEKRFQEWVISTAKNTGWRIYHTHDSRRSVKGYPDLHLIRSDRQIFAELKSTKGVLSKDQKEWLSALRSMIHNEVYLWRPSDWKVIEEKLK
ncbi:VRR-NUC domain protein [uncultured Mediterranean phage uvDeep-CGR2-KM18-C74]|nr:VRR-NUC domain protein [uncultured Mediterranean phage uvDeep-CGR2-KM18-C74]